MTYARFVWPGIATAIIQVAAVPLEILVPDPDGRWGAPFPYFTPRCFNCPYGFDGVDGPVLLVDLVATAVLLFALGFAVRRLRWVPTVGACSAVYLVVTFPPWSEGMLARGISLDLWLIAVAGYAVGVIVALLLTRRDIRVP